MKRKKIWGGLPTFNFLSTLNPYLLQNPRIGRSLPANPLVTPLISPIPHVHGRDVKPVFQLYYCRLMYIYELIVLQDPGRLTVYLQGDLNIRFRIRSLPFKEYGFKIQFFIQ